MITSNWTELSEIESLSKNTSYDVYHRSFSVHFSNVESINFMVAAIAPFSWTYSVLLPLTVLP